MSARIFLVSIPGIEDVALSEAKEIFGEEAVKEAVLNFLGFHGSVYLELKGADASTLDLYFSQARAVERVIWVLHVEEKYIKGDSEEELAELFRGIIENIKSVLCQAFRTTYSSFAVSVTKRGEFQVKSPVMARILGTEIVNVLQQNRSSLIEPLVVLDDPLVLFRLYISNKGALLGVDICGKRALHYRDYRVYYHPAALNAIVAYAMAKLAKVEEAEKILDPMCGSGTLLIEAGFVNRRAELYGIDINPQHVRGALSNIEQAGFKNRARITVGDGTRINEVFPGMQFDRILVNPPYGIRERTFSLSKLYYDLLKSCSSVLVGGGMIALVTPRRKLVQRCVARISELKVVETRRVDHGGLTLYIFVIVKNEII